MTTETSMACVGGLKISLLPISVCAEESGRSRRPRNTDGRRASSERERRERGRLPASLFFLSFLLPPRRLRALLVFLLEPAKNKEISEGRTSQKEEQPKEGGGRDGGWRRNTTRAFDLEPPISITFLFFNNTRTGYLLLHCRWSTN